MQLLNGSAVKQSLPTTNIVENTLGNLMVELRLLHLLHRMSFRYHILILLPLKSEEAFVASLSSCHMLFFLSIAAKRKFVVESYIDKAVGIMEKNENGPLAVTKVYLHPQITFALENLPTEEQLEKMHHEAHHSCFLANSVKTEIIIEAKMSRVQ